MNFNAITMQPPRFLGTRSAFQKPQPPQVRFGLGFAQKRREFVESMVRNCSVGALASLYADPGPNCPFPSREEQISALEEALIASLNAAKGRFETRQPGPTDDMGEVKIYLDSGRLRDKDLPAAVQQAFEAALSAEQKMKG